VALLSGVAGFLFGPGHPREPWIALLVNFLFWTTLAQGAVVWAAVLRLAGTRWGAPLIRVGEGAVAFLPLSLLLLLALYPGRALLLPWLGQDLGDRAAWLNLPAVSARLLGGLALMTALSLVYVRLHLLPAAGPRPRFALSVALPVAYAVVYSLVAFDLVMSLRPFWVSSLLGPYFFTGGMYAAMAAMIVLTAHTPRRLGRQRWLDTGNLLLAFGMLTTYMLFTQLLVIWYENLPAETIFLLPRYSLPPWHALSWVMLGVGLLGPFLALLIKGVKTRPHLLRIVAAAALLGMGLERYLLVAPSLTPQNPVVGAPTVLITLGCGGLCLLSWLAFLYRYPPTSPVDDARAAAPPASAHRPSVPREVW
jgi:hypothetical protein